ncbi:MAG: hypothetical protein AB7O68_08165 [Pirellulales bacterium]
MIAVHSADSTSAKIARRIAAGNFGQAAMILAKSASFSGSLGQFLEQLLALLDASSLLESLRIVVSLLWEQGVGGSNPLAPTMAAQQAAKIEQESSGTGEQVNWKKRRYGVKQPALPGSFVQLINCPSSAPTIAFMDVQQAAAPTSRGAI